LWLKLNNEPAKPRIFYVAKSRATMSTKWVLTLRILWVLMDENNYIAGPFLAGALKPPADGMI